MTASSHIPALARVSRNLTPLERCYQMLIAAANKGFEWPDASFVLGKVNEEWGEVDQAIAEGNPDAIGEEIGDTLSAVINLARYQNIALPSGILSINDTMPLSDIDHGKHAMQNEIKNADRALLHHDHDALSGAIRGMLIALSEIARHYELHAADCLHATNTKFETRFTAVESTLSQQGKRMEDTPLKDMVRIWNAQKGEAQVAFRCM